MYLYNLFTSTISVLVSGRQALCFFLKSTYSAHINVSPAFRFNLFAQREAKRIFTSIRFMEPGFVLAIQNLGAYKN